MRQEGRAQRDSILGVLRHSAIMSSAPPPAPHDVIALVLFSVSERGVSDQKEHFSRGFRPLSRVVPRVYASPSRPAGRSRRGWSSAPCGRVVPPSMGNQ